MAVKPPYKPCRLVHHNYDLNKRWYVVFYAWNVSTETLDRKRIFNPINRKKTVDGRLNVARELMSDIDAALIAGKVLGKTKRSATDEISNFTLTQAIDYFVQKKTEAKRRHNYLKRFSGNLKFHINNFDGPDVKIKCIDTEYFEELCDYLRRILPAAKTFNNYRADLITVLNFINKVRPGTIKDKPWATTDKLKVVAKKHAAFSDDQMRAIIDKATEMGFHQVVLFCQFLYYTLARPNEVLSIRRRDIDLDNNRIIISGENAKNWRDEYVTVSPRFNDIITKSDILNAGPDEYVFGYMLHPGPERHPDEGYFYYRMKKVLKELGYLKLNPNYTLYSCKHSGAVALYLATKDITAVQEQCRHNSIQQTWEYLRDLGLLRKESPVMAWEGVI